MESGPEWADDKILDNRIDPDIKIKNLVKYNG